MHEIKVKAMQFKDIYGYMQPDRRISHNGIRFTSEYYLILKKHNILDEADLSHFQLLILKCFKQPGLLERHPYEHHNVQEGPDDYIALMHAASELGFIDEICAPILSYGQRNFFCYHNVDKPTWKDRLSSFFLRQPSTIAHFYFACGLKPPLLFYISWLLNLTYTSFFNRDKQDDWILSWHCADTAFRHDKLVDIVVRFWEWQRKRKQIDLGELMGEYFQNRDHVLSKYFISNIA